MTRRACPVRPGGGSSPWPFAGTTQGGGALLAVTELPTWAAILAILALLVLWGFFANTVVLAHWPTTPATPKVRRG